VRGVVIFCVAVLFIHVKLTTPLKQRHGDSLHGLVEHRANGISGRIDLQVWGGLGTVKQLGQRVLHLRRDHRAGDRPKPLTSNTDQGSQFTNEAFLEVVEEAGWK
jgi:transposase InsO family protein